MDQGPVLPQELFDLVIDHLLDDLESLRVCAVVSSSFLHSSRMHLFSHLKVGPFDQEHCIDELHEILTKSPVLAARVQSLHLWDHIMRRQSWFVKYPQLAPGVGHLSRTLPSLQRFCITVEAGFVHWANISDALRTAVCYTVTLPTLTCLELTGLYGLPFTLLANCPALRSVTLKWVTFDERDNLDFAVTVAACAGSPPTQLERLSIDLDTRVFVLLARWILLPQSPLDITRLTSFACTLDHKLDHFKVQDLLDVCAPTLEHFQLKNIRGPLDLSAAARLRTLRLHTADLPWLPSPPQPVALVVAIASESEMSQLDAAQISRSFAGVTFILAPQKEGKARERDLVDVSAAFAHRGMLRVLRSRLDEI
ncbi:hypothetical protein B0H17DRAFT_1046190 [Mycena rosella]|uniref:F-box domain-containing protein n=1 Tax=Mycena rosella TaxID=1033263 RepID=A0AAD7DZ04_MYCRO|nr:hypothetical protein B0H17DRAFT_1046190 [Mycena rosella]